MLRYPEVYKDLRFLICTMPFELCVANNINLDAETNDDGFFVTCILDQFCSKNRTYQIGVKIPLTKGSQLMIYNSQDFLLKKLPNFTLDILNYYQLLKKKAIIIFGSISFWIKSWIQTKWIQALKIICNKFSGFMDFTNKWYYEKID